MRDHQHTAPRVLTLIADLLRVAVLAGTVVALLSDEVEGALRLGLVFLILLVPRLAGLPRPIDLAVSVLLPLATAASLFHWYRAVGWLDWVMHAATTGALAAMSYLLLVRSPLLPAREHPSAGSMVLLTTMAGVTIGVVWEFYEWCAEKVFGIRIGVGYTDTVADLAMDTLGSLAAGLVLCLLPAGAIRGRTE